MLVVTLFLLLFTNAVSNAELISCQTPNDQNGICVPINHCPSIYNIFKRLPLSNSTKKFLWRSHCGFVEVAYPKVCCPLGSSTPPKTSGNENETDSRHLLPKVCGISTETKIFGGKVTALEEYPWMALLEYEVDGKRVFLCGGSLINKRYVMTARHCLTGSLVVVRLGEHNTTTDPDCTSKFGRYCAPNVQKLTIEERIRHPDADIALLRLSQDAEFNDYVKPICLPASDEVLNHDEKFMVAGWGATENNFDGSNVKLKVQLPLVGFSDCVDKLANSKAPDIHEYDICAGGEKGKDSCVGDSGGPLMHVKIDKKKDVFWYAAGVVSWGPVNPCGKKNEPGIYVRVSRHVNWILKIIKP